MPNQIGPHLEQRIVAFALADPAFGPGGSAPSWQGRSGDGLRISEHGVWRVLVRLRLNTRAKRLALVARHRDPYGDRELDRAGASRRDLRRHRAVVRNDKPATVDATTLLPGGEAVPAESRSRRSNRFRGHRDAPGER
jgi:hypothetical protein